MAEAPFLASVEATLGKIVFGDKNIILFTAITFEIMLTAMMINLSMILRMLAML